MSSRAAPIAAIIAGGTPVEKPAEHDHQHDHRLLPHRPVLELGRGQRVRDA